MVILGVFFFLQPISENTDLPFHEKLIFLTFFTGALLCLGFSFTFHTLLCHSKEVNRVFNKLDYAGIR